MNKVLYQKRRKEESETSRFFIYRLFHKVVNLTKNERSKGKNDKKGFDNYS